MYKVIWRDEPENYMQGERCHTWEEAVKWAQFRESQGCYDVDIVAWEEWDGDGSFVWILE